ncbi:MAG: alpha/beta fold hydrolase [Myxococcota bacterium]
MSLAGGDDAVLLLHGLTGSPHQVAPIAHALAAAGLSVRVPLLPGHDAVESLEASTFHDWYGAAQRELRTLIETHGGPRRVVVAGFSMGSLLALRLAALCPGDVCGTVAMAVPLQMPRWQRAAVGLMSKLRARPALGPLVGVFPKLGGPDVRISRAQRSSASLPAFPYPALAQLVALQDDVARLLPLVRTPLLLVHGRYDHTAPAAQSERVAQRVSSARVERVVLPRSFHIIARDLDADRACAEVTRFVQSVFASLPPTTPTP